MYQFLSEFTLFLPHLNVLSQIWVCLNLMIFKNIRWPSLIQNLFWVESCAIKPALNKSKYTTCFIWNTTYVTTTSAGINTHYLDFRISPHSKCYSFFHHMRYWCSFLLIFLPFFFFFFEKTFVYFEVCLPFLEFNESSAILFLSKFLQSYCRFNDESENKKIYVDY